MVLTTGIPSFRKLNLRYRSLKKALRKGSADGFKAPWRTLSDSDTLSFGVCTPTPCDRILEHCQRRDADEQASDLHARECAVVRHAVPCAHATLVRQRSHSFGDQAELCLSHIVSAFTLLL